MIEGKEIPEDYLARLNLDGTRNVWESNRVKLDYVLKKTGRYFRHASAVCDIGIGDGYLLRRFKAKGFEVTGIDISEYCIRQLREEFSGNDSGVTLIYADISSTTVPEGRFDLVTCFDVLEHIPEGKQNQTLRKLRNSLTETGCLVGTLPLGENLHESLVMCPECGHRFHRIGHYHSFQSTAEMAEFLGKDFRIVKTGEVPNPWFKSGFLNSLSYLILKLAKRLAHRKITATVYFVAIPAGDQSPEVSS